MPIPPERIEETLERTDLVALVSRYVELKPSGRSFKGLCPFHGEKTPSFFVVPHRRFFKCHGCGAYGDAITFLTRINGSTFLDAVRELAREAGVDLEEREDPSARQRSQIREALEWARRHFEERLWTDPRARPGREHLARRGVDETTARRFGIGYALLAWNDLSDRLVREGILEWGANAGLCARNRQGDGFYDTFRGRLMIPIRSPEGHTIAFGARLVEARPGADPGPKYLNSRENLLYRKSEVLYALDLAREPIRKQRCAVLVEGYFDAIGLHAAGLDHAVALCSTALTAGHLAALERAGAQQLVLLLDGDEAGLKAIERLAGPILAAGARARVACLPQGDDPDTFVLREGRARMEALLAGAPPLSQHLLQQALPGGRGAGFEEKMAALARLKPILAQVPAGVARSALIAEVAEHFGVPEADLRAELAVEGRRARRPAGPSRPAAEGPDPQEAFLAALLLYDATLRGPALEQGVDPVRAVDLRLMLASDHPEEALAALREPMRRLVCAQRAEIERTLGGDENAEARRKALADVTARLRLTRLNEQIEDKRAELQQALEAGAADEVQAAQAELKQLFDTRNRLKVRGGALAAPGGNA